MEANDGQYQTNKPNSLRSFLENHQTEVDDLDEDVDLGELDEEASGSENDDSEGSDGDFEREIEAEARNEVPGSITLPFMPDPSVYGATSAQPRPYLLIANEALRHFWEQYFADKQYVRWTTFLNKLENHLSSPVDASDDPSDAEITHTGAKPAGLTSLVIPDKAGKYPVLPNGYGLHQNELYALFRERDGKRSLTKALQYALDLEGTGVLSVYQVAIVVQNILPADLSLKHLLFHLAHLGGKVILPPTLYPLTTAAEFAVSVHAAFARAVAAEKDYNTQLLKAQQVAARRRAGLEVGDTSANNKTGLEQSLSLTGLYSPFAGAGGDLQGPVALQDSIEAFVERTRVHPQESPTSHLAPIHILAAPCGQGATCRVTAALRAHLHTAHARHHSLLTQAAVSGSLSVWDLLHGPNSGGVGSGESSSGGGGMGGGGCGGEFIRTTAARLLDTAPGAHSLSTQNVVFPIKEVASDDFAVAGLFDAIYIDLRGRTTKADVLAAFSAQLALRGADSNLTLLQDSLSRFFRTLRVGSVLVLDHVHVSAAVVVKKLVQTLCLSVEYGRVSVIVIPSMQCASPILTAVENTISTNPKVQRLYGSAGRRRAAWEKEQEQKSTTFFLSELRKIVTSLGTPWSTTSNTITTNASPNTNSEDGNFTLPKNVMLLTYCLTPDETRAATERLYRELKTRETLVLEQTNTAVVPTTTIPTTPTNTTNHTTNTTNNTTNTTSTTVLESLSTEKLDAICSVSGGIPCLMRLLLWQSLHTLNCVLAKRNETSTMPSYMSTANTVKGARTSTTNSTNATTTTTATSPKRTTSNSNLTALVPPVVVANPYTGLPSVYSVSWELQQPSALALTEDDRLFLYALSPLLYAHLHGTKDSSTSTSANSAKPSTTRPYPLSFDGALAWHLCKVVFVQQITSSSQHNSVQTFTNGKRVDVVVEEAYRRFVVCWDRLVNSGWLVVVPQGLPLPSALPTSTSPSTPVGNTVVHVVDALVPQYLSVKKTLHCTLPTSVTEVVTDDTLMSTYLHYISSKFSETSQALALIDKLLVSPEAGYSSTLLHQKQLIILRSVENVLLPHFTFLTTLIKVQLTPLKRGKVNVSSVSKARSVGSVGSAGGVTADTSEDEGEGGAGRDRVPSMSSETSDPMEYMRRSNSSKLGEGVDRSLSYSQDDSDNNNNNNRQRTTSEMSSDNEGGVSTSGAGGGREGVVPPFERAGSSDTSFSLLTSTEAAELLASWAGHLRHLALLRLPSDMGHALATQCGKVLSEQSKPSLTDPAARKLHYTAALYDLGVMLYAQYAEYQHDAQLGAGWSRGSLHCNSVESSVSRHLAEQCSKMLLEALQTVAKALPNTTKPVPTTTTLTAKQIVSLLELQARIEFSLGELYLTIASEAQRMHLVARTTTTVVNNALLVKLYNKSRVAEAQGVDYLLTQLPATLTTLRTHYNTTNTTNTSGNDTYKRYLSELQNYNLRNGSSPRPAPTPTRGISLNADTDTTTLPDTLRSLVEVVHSERLAADASVLVAEYYSKYAISRKLGDVNAAFVQCMAPPPTPAHNHTSTSSNTNTNTSKGNSAPQSPKLPLPRGIITDDNTNTTNTSNTTTSTSNTTLVNIVDPTKKAAADRAAYLHANRNAMYPLLLHTGQQDLRYMLLDREYLVHQQLFIDKLNEQSSGNSVRASVEGSVVFTDVLTTEEESELSVFAGTSTGTTTAGTIDDTKFTNAHLVHCYRTALHHYTTAITLYNTLYGAGSIASSEVSILLANMHRVYGSDEIAKPLYEAALQVFKTHHLATYQLPTAMTAHCWLGLASYFDEHQIGLPSLYEHNLATSNSTNSGTSGSNSGSGGNKGKNDLALRLYEEALNIYKSVYPCTHYTVCLTSHALVGVLCGLKRFDRGSVLLNECIAITKIAKNKDGVMERYLVRQVRVEQRKAKTSTSTNTTNTTSLTSNFRNLTINTTPTTSTNTNTNLLKAQLALESNELALQSTTSYLGTTLTVLARLHDLNKAHHIAIGLYKEAIVCMRELRVTMVRRYREKQQLLQGQQGEDSDNDADDDDEEEDAELGITLGTNQPERELALHIAQTMRDLAQSLFAEGVKHMGGKKIHGQSVPDFQYRHALYVMNRAIEIYQGFDLSISATLLKDTFTQRATLHTLQSDYPQAKHCYEQIMRLFMEVKFENCAEIAQVRTDYARLLVQCNEAGEAALLYEQSIDVYRRKLGDNWVCMEVAVNLLERGAALLDIKAYEDAQPCLEDALLMLPMVINGTTTPSTSITTTTTTTVDGNTVVTNTNKAMFDVRMGACYAHLASIFHYYEEHEQALSHYKSAQQVYVNAGKAFSLEMANVCNNLATLHDDMGQLPEAKAMYEQTVVILFRFHGAAHPQILVTLENLMNLLQDMKLDAEYQSVLDHLDVMEKQITEANEEDTQRLEALNRALYGQALAEQDRRAALAAKNKTHSGASGVGGGGREGGAGSSSGDARSPRHPFAPQQVVIVGGGDGELSDVEEGEGEGEGGEGLGLEEAEDQLAMDSYDVSDSVLQSMQAQEQALQDEADSFFSFNLSRSINNLATLASPRNLMGGGVSGAGVGGNAEEQWGKQNRGHDGALDEEDGFKYGNPSSPSHRSPYATTSPTSASGGIDVDYLGDFNNSAELQAMRREMSKFSTRSAASGAISSTGKGRGSIADTYKRGTGNTSKMRALRPLGQVVVEEEEELPAGGNCVVM